MHAVAVRLHDSGVDDHVIAVALEIDDEQVTTVLGLAHAKLANVMAIDQPATISLDSPSPQFSPVPSRKDIA